MKKTKQTRFSVPGKRSMSKENWQLSVTLKKRIGFLPNLYAYMTKSETALQDYIQLRNRVTTLSEQEKEVIKLLVSQLNHCCYWQSAHTEFVKLTGLTEAQTIDVRKGGASFDPGLDALIQFTTEVINHRGRVSSETKTMFFNAGYSEANLIDIVMNIGDVIITNYLQNIVELENDFPIADNIYETI